MKPGAVSRLGLVGLLASLALVAGPAAARPAAGVPSERQWLADVHAVLADAPDYVRARSDDTGGTQDDRLAVNLDIDNSAIASYFHGGAIPEVLRLTRLAQRHHVAVLFNTARLGTHRARTLAQLRGSGYRVDGLCMRLSGETKVHSKQRCRDQFAAAGYTLIADIGNNATDFAGTGYERAFRLPNYGGLLP